MMHEQVEIQLHNRSVIRVSRTQAGATYVELLTPMNLGDGYGMATAGSAFLSVPERRTLAGLLATTAYRFTRSLTSRTQAAKPPWAHVRAVPTSRGRNR